MSQSFSHIEINNTILKLCFIFCIRFFRLLDRPMQTHQRDTILTHLFSLTVLELFPFLGQNLELEFAWSFTLKRIAKTCNFSQFVFKNVFIKLLLWNFCKISNYQNGWQNIYRLVNTYCSNEFVWNKLFCFTTNF